MFSDVMSRAELIPGEVGISSLMSSGIIENHVQWIRQKVALNQVAEQSSSRAFDPASISMECCDSSHST